MRRWHGCREQKKEGIDRQLTSISVGIQSHTGVLRHSLIFIQEYIKFRFRVAICIAHNYIRLDGTDSLAGVLAQCTALAHLDLSGSVLRRIQSHSTMGSKLTTLRLR